MAAPATPLAPNVVRAVDKTNFSIEKYYELYYDPLSPQIVFPFLCLFGGLLMNAVATMLGQPILSAVGLLAIGFIVPELTNLILPGAERTHDVYFERYTWQNMPWIDVMMALLPILIFESAFNIKYYEFKKHLLEILALAVPCFFLGFLLLGCMMYGLLWLIGYTKWSFNVCLLYSATISATDPVAVVMLLSKLSVPHRLRLLLEGESLLNDGLALILYNIMDALVRAEMGHPNPSGIFLTVVWLLLFVSLSVLVGSLCAKIAGFLFTKLVDGLKQRCIIILFNYFTYFACEAMHGSGILGIVAYALMLNSEKSGLSAQTNRFNKTTWQFFAFWANCILFVLTGLLASKTFQRSLAENSFTGLQLLTIASWSYMASFVSRFLSLAVYTLFTGYFCQVHSRWFFPWSYTTMLTWSGLRGSIALLLAIRTNDEDLFDSIAPLACGCVAFTVLVTNFFHTFTATTVANRLNFTQLSYAKQKRITLLVDNMNGFIKSLRETYVNTQAYFWNDVLWEKVEELSTIQPVEEKDHGEEGQDFPVLHNTKTGLGKNGDAADAAEVEITSRLVVMDMMSAYTLILGERRIMSNEAVRFMTNAINDAMDQRTAVDVEQLYKQVEPWMWVRKLSSYLTNSVWKPIDGFLNRHPVLRQWILESNANTSGMALWDFIWHILIFARCIIIIRCVQYNSLDNVYQYWLFVQWAMSLIFCAEICVRWLLEGKDYQKKATLWIFYDRIRLVLYVISVCSIYYISQSCFEDDTKSQVGATGNSTIADSVHRDITQCHILVYANALSLVELLYVPFWFLYLLPRITIDQLQYIVAKADHLSLELMHSVVLMAEHVMEGLEKAASAVVLGSEQIRENLEAENLEMSQKASSKMIEILNSQEQNSRWIIYIKTVQVSQMILCEAKNLVEREFTMGDIDRDSNKILHRKLRDRVQKLDQLTEQQIREPNLAECLAYVPWIQGSSKAEEIINFVCEKAVKKICKIGECLMKQGEMAIGAYFLKRGICRFAIEVAGAQPIKKHLLYAGQFIGEKAFLSAGVDRKTPFKPPLRSGSVYAETFVIAYFLKAQDALDILRIDPTIGNQFEEMDVLNRCRDFLRRVQAFSNFTIPALDKRIRRNWQIYNQADTTSDVIDGSSLVLIKGTFTVQNRIVTVDTPIKLDGPHEPVKVHAAPEHRCFVLVYFEDYTVQQQKDQQKQQHHHESGMISAALLPETEMSSKSVNSKTA